MPPPIIFIIQHLPFIFFNAKKKTFYYSNKRFNTVCAEISRFAASGITND